MKLRMFMEGIYHKNKLFRGVTDGTKLRMGHGTTLMQLTHVFYRMKSALVIIEALLEQDN